MSHNDNGVPDIGLDESMNMYPNDSSSNAGQLINHQTNELSRGYSQAATPAENQDITQLNFYGGQPQVYHNNSFQFNRPSITPAQTFPYTTRQSRTTHSIDALQQPGQHREQATHAYAPFGPTQHLYNGHVHGTFPQRQFGQENYPVAFHSEGYGTNASEHSSRFSSLDSLAQESSFPDRFDAFSRSANINPFQRRDSLHPQSMARQGSFQQFVNTEFHDQGSRLYGMGSTEQYPAELLAMDPYSFANIPHLEQHALVGNEQQIPWSSQIPPASQAPGEWHPSMSFEELITPDRVQMPPLDAQRISSLGTQHSAREVIDIESDRDEVKEHPKANVAARDSAPQRALPTWDPSINDINSAKAWLNESRDSLQKFEVYGDDVEEVSREALRHAHELFNALQNPPPPPPEKCEERKDGAEYYNRYQQNALDKIDKCFLVEKTRKIAQSNSVVAIQMVIDMHRNGLPLFLFDDKRPWRLASSDRKLRCSQRVELMLKAVSEIKTVALEIADWDGPKVEDFVRNPKKTLHTRVSGISSNQVKRTRAIPANRNKVSRQSLASSPAASPGRQNHMGQAGSQPQLVESTPAPEAYGNQMMGPARTSQASQSSKRSREVSDEDIEEISSMTFRAPQRRRENMPSNFGAFGPQSNFMS